MPTAANDRHGSPNASTRRHGRLDEAAFDALFRECSRDLHAYVISLLGDRSTAEDVTALAFERLYRFRSRLNRGRGTPRALLFTIARNAALDELRQRKRQPKLELAEERFAQALDISESNVGTRLHRALVRLREQCLELDRKEVA
jgi:DNA-directed RNA polymerase specialized sigma24 family protein